MSKQKVYYKQDDSYGETFITVNDTMLTYIDYHKPNSSCVEDQALSILADYFEELPTREQLTKGQSKCWKFHLDFVKAFMSNWRIIWSEDIQSWIDQQTIKEALERELTKTFDHLPFTSKITKSERKERKVYHITEETDGSTVVLVNDRWLEDIRYHQPIGDLCFEDMALTILVDYLEEQPVEGQFAREQSKSWELHMDFADELASNWRRILFPHQIEAWINKYNSSKNLEQELTKMLESLPIPIKVVKEKDSYSWEWLDYKGIASTYVDAMGSALKYAMSILRDTTS